MRRSDVFGEVMILHILSASRPLTSDFGVRRFLSRTAEMDRLEVYFDVLARE